MNILFYCNEYPPYPSGGIGVFTKELAESLVEFGNIVVYGQYTDIKGMNVTFSNGVIFIQREKKTGKLAHIINRVRAYFDLKKIITKHRIHFLEVQDFAGLLAFYPKLGCKVLIRLHGSIAYFNKLLKKNSFKNRIWYLLEKSSLNKADKIVSVSNFTSVYSQKLFNLKQNVTVIYNGINIPINYTRQISRDKIIFTFAGSLIKKKGIIEMIQAWIIFNQQLKVNVELHIFGKDIEGLLSSLKKMVKEAKLGNVYFHGSVAKEELMHFYNRVSFAIFPTKAEAFSLAPMEAMSSGVVVLYSNQTSASELIQHGYNGFLLENYNHPSEIAKQMLSLLSLDNYDSVSNNARMTIESFFNIENICQTNIQYYRDLLNNE